MKFTITINGEAKSPAAYRKLAQKFVKDLEALEDRPENIKQAIFNCDKAEDQLDLLHERYRAQTTERLEAANLDERGARK